ncbi:sulfotransferase domain-containing protein [candidate division KSB1 bacterium]|nr:sulfotransferase domain-containing protein [candidate division KSB1 bacterium]
MWIFCCGMPRSGSTLHFQMTAQIVEEAGLGRRVEWVKPKLFRELRNQYAEDASWKVFKTHYCTETMTKEFRRRNAVGLYIYRDLRDVFVSAMRKYELTFELMWQRPFLDNCLEYYETWTSLPNVMVSKYEEMMADLPAEVGRIAAHLGLQLEAGQCHQIAAAYSLERQKERIEEATHQGNLRPRTVDGPLYDPHTQLYTNHIHSGEIGGWKEVLSSEQVTRLETKAGHWLVAQGYELSEAFEKNTLNAE